MTLKIIPISYIKEDDMPGFEIFGNAERKEVTDVLETGVLFRKARDLVKHLSFYSYKKSFLDKLVALPTDTCEQVEKLEQLRVLEFGYRIKVVITSMTLWKLICPKISNGLKQGLR